MVTIRVIPIIPGKLVDDKVLRAEIKSALDKTGERMRKKFTKTVEGWVDAPAMAYESEVSDDASVWSGPTGAEEMIEKWRRIDEGTEERDIVSGTGRPMIFPFQGRGQSYGAKTTRRQFSSAPYWTKYGPLRSTMVVHRHSIEAREWSEQMIDEEEDGFVADIQAAIDKGLL